MGNSNTTKTEDLIDLFNRDIKIYGKETKEIKALLKNDFIEQSEDNKGKFFIKKQ